VLILSIAADESAVAKYSMIRQILDNPEYKEIIDRTIEEEKAHYRKLQEMLEKVKETYKARTGEKQA
jgi:rubrerythrin